jgi:NAD(P)-dependent dehydrogenase (short-subunit alcohol dehydrogenase family)
MREFVGKVAVITGGASGIGLGIAEAVGREGMSVMVADIEPEALDHAVTRLRGLQIPAEGVVTDVTSRASVEAAADAALAAFGKVHLVCNNAGVSLGGEFGQIAPEDWNWVLDVNLKGVIYGVETFVPLIEAHGEGGHVVNTASLVGMLSPSGLEPYAATKYAVVAMTEGWARQLAPKGIGMSALCPGYVHTRIGQARRNRPARYGEDKYVPPSNPRSMIGLQPDAVGRRVVEGVKADELYIFTSPEAKQQVAERFARILAAFDTAAASSVFASAVRG